MIIALYECRTNFDIVRIFILIKLIITINVFLIFAFLAAKSALKVLKGDCDEACDI